MSHKKRVGVVYVEAIPKERSGIGQDVPPHIVLEWLDKDGRRNKLPLLYLSDQQVKELSEVDDLPLAGS